MSISNSSSSVPPLPIFDFRQCAEHQQIPIQGDMDLQESETISPRTIGELIKTNEGDVEIKNYSQCSDGRHRHEDGHLCKVRRYTFTPEYLVCINNMLKQSFLDSKQRLTALIEGLSNEPIDIPQATEELEKNARVFLKKRHSDFLVSCEEMLFKSAIDHLRGVSCARESLDDPSHYAFLLNNLNGFNVKDFEGTSASSDDNTDLEETISTQNSRNDNPKIDEDQFCFYGALGRPGENIAKIPLTNLIKPLNNVVLVDIFAREQGADVDQKIMYDSKRKTLEMHTICLWKIRENDGKMQVRIIDPSDVSKIQCFKSVSCLSRFKVEYQLERFGSDLAQSGSVPPQPALSKKLASSQSKRGKKAASASSSSTPLSSSNNQQPSPEPTIVRKNENVEARFYIPKSAPPSRTEGSSLKKPSPKSLIEAESCYDFYLEKVPESTPSSAAPPPLSLPAPIAAPRPLGPSIDQPSIKYRDCIDVAVKIAFKLNELQQICEDNRVIIGCLKTLSNQYRLNPYLGVKITKNNKIISEGGANDSTPIRDLLSSNPHIRFTASGLYFQCSKVLFRVEIQDRPFTHPYDQHAIYPLGINPSLDTVIKNFSRFSRCLDTMYFKNLSERLTLDKIEKLSRLMEMGTSDLITVDHPPSMLQFLKDKFDEIGGWQIQLVKKEEAQQSSAQASS